jgi:hypothetical protein
MGWLNLAGALAIAVGVWRGVEKIFRELEKECNKEEDRRA